MDKNSDFSKSKFFKEMDKSKNLDFDYEVSKMIIENEQNLISQMYFFDKQSNENSKN